MSDNNRFYVQKMAQKRAGRRAYPTLRHQLEDILRFVRECEARWVE